MPTDEDVPTGPADLVTARQFGRYLAARIRGRRTQAALSRAVRRLMDERSPEDRGRFPMQELPVQRISAMENSPGRVPTETQLRSYLAGCGRVDVFEALNAARLRILRGIEEAERPGAAAAHDGAGDSVESARSATPALAVPAGLPSDGQFVGRAAELEMLARVLAPGRQAAVATVAGLAGAGKTALALRAAELAVSEGWFPGGAFLVDLRGYDSAGAVEPAAALEAVLRVLGADHRSIPTDAAGREALYRSTLAALAEKGARLLLVADNASELAQVAPLRPDGTAHRMIVTSRHSLPLTGARRVELDVLAPQDAAALLSLALGTANPDDGRVAAEPDAAAELATLCGHLPLALRITAEVVADKPQQPIREVVDIMADSPDPLGELAYGDSFGVRLAFDASYRRLPTAQSRLFRLAALHPGPDIGLDALAALADLPRDEARHLVEGVRRAHLLRSDAVSTGYRFHDLVRLYAAERCEQEQTTRERRAAIRRLLDHYRDTVTAANTHIAPNIADADRSARFADHGAALDWLEQQWPNLVAAAALAAASGRDEHTRDIGMALRFFFYRRKYWDAWISTGLLALEAAHRLGELFVEGTALNSLCSAYNDCGRWDEANEYGHRALELWRRAGDRAGEGRALINIGNTHHLRGQFEQSLAWHRRALPAIREGGDRYSTAQALNNLGFMLAEARRFDQAGDYLREAYALFRELGERSSEGVALTNLGDVERELGRLDDAERSHRAALELFRQFADRYHEGRALNNLALVDRARGRLADALAHHREALEICRQVGDRHVEGMALEGLAATYAELGQSDDAASCYRDALAAFRDAHSTRDAERVAAVISALDRRFDLDRASDRDQGPDSIRSISA